MKTTGIVRNVDSLGRIVIPREIRHTLQLEDNASIEIFVDGDLIIFKRYSPVIEDSLTDKEDVKINEEEIKLLKENIEIIIETINNSKRDSIELLEKELEEKRLQLEKKEEQLRERDSLLKDYKILLKETKDKVVQIEELLQEQKKPFIESLKWWRK